MGLLIGIRNNFKSISRYNQILKVLLKYGFEDLVFYLDESKRYTFFQKLIPKSYRDRALLYTKWAKMRLVCEELGPTFVKFGQILSNRPDLVPWELTLDLEKLQDTVPPMPEATAKSLVESELKDKVENLFAWFEPKPFASASMAQVHKVTMHSGNRIALKVQRVGIYDIIIEDIKVMYKIAHVLEKRVPSIKSFDPIGLVKHFEHSILKEMDFINESINIQRFYNNLLKDDSLEQFALAPRIYPSYTTSKVLAMEFMAGIKIDRMRSLEVRRLIPRSLPVDWPLAISNKFLNMDFFMPIRILGIYWYFPTNIYAI